MAAPIPRAAPVTRATDPSRLMEASPSRWSFAGGPGEVGGSLLEMRRQPFPSVGPAEPEELVPQARIEGGPHHPVPVVERQLRPPDRRLGAVGERLGNLERLR